MNWNNSCKSAQRFCVRFDGRTPRFLESWFRPTSSLVDARPRSLRRQPAKTPLWTIFYETLIQDFDTLLWLNPTAKPVEVTAVADALVRPDFADNGFHDTALVTIRFDNGSIAVAEANFCAMYGYDIRGEVFGSDGMVMMGDVRRSSATLYDKNGVSNDTWRRNFQKRATPPPVCAVIGVQPRSLLPLRTLTTTSPSSA